MSAPPTPKNEATRLARLMEYGVLDTVAEESFDRITRLAAHILNTPIALVSLVDKDRQWFKSRVGLDAPETPRDVAFCAHAICETDVMVVEDTQTDRRFANNPLVVHDPSIRFYAGAQLRTPDGYSLGTLCAIDRKPRQLTKEQIDQLRDLAAIVQSELEQRVLVAKALRAQQRLADAVEAQPNGFALYDSDDRLVMCNRRYSELYPESADLFVPGVTFEEIIRCGVKRGQYPEAIGNEEAWIAERLETHRHPGEPIEQELADGRWLRIEERHTHDGELVGFRVDITELKRQQLELTELASVDSLTGALNRRGFMEMAEIEKRRAARSSNRTAMLLLDIDHFKQINDQYGHSVGDTILKSLVTRWHATIRGHDHLGRLGGEEFAVLLADIDSATAEMVAERLRNAACSTPVETKGQHIRVAASIGVAIGRTDAETLDDMLARADKALYAAKEAGRNRCMTAAA